MKITLADYQKINSFLLNNNIDSILYGSLGVSVYLGNFKEFGDIDLLIDDKYLLEQWPTLVDVMAKNEFELFDLHEHEFKNKEGVIVAFAEKSVLIRDKICDPVADSTIIETEGVKVKTITRQAFINAYTFSSTDGYRIEKRGKNDINIVEKLSKLINQ